MLDPCLARMTEYYGQPVWNSRHNLQTKEKLCISGFKYLHVSTKWNLLCFKLSPETAGILFATVISTDWIFNHEWGFCASPSASRATSTWVFSHFHPNAFYVSTPRGVRKVLPAVQFVSGALRSGGCGTHVVGACKMANFRFHWTTNLFNWQRWESLSYFKRLVCNILPCSKDFTSACAASREEPLWCLNTVTELGRLTRPKIRSRHTWACMQIMLDIQLDKRNP